MSEIDPADGVAGGTAEIPEEFTADLETGAAGSRLKQPVREGLPSGYRMRADAADARRSRGPSRRHPWRDDRLGDPAARRA